MCLFLPPRSCLLISSSSACCGAVSAPATPPAPSTSHNDCNRICLRLLYHVIALRVSACTQRHGVVSTIEANETY